VNDQIRLAAALGNLDAALKRLAPVRLALASVRMDESAKLIAEAQSLLNQLGQQLAALQQVQGHADGPRYGPSREGG
jgi:hypothetical protein